MKTSSIEENILLTGCKNLCILTTKQLECIQQEDYTSLAEVLAQKQLIIESITGSNTLLSLIPDGELIRQDLVSIISDTLVLEQKSKALLESKKPEIIAKIMSANKSKLIDKYFAQVSLTTNFLEEKI